MINIHDFRMLEFNGMLYSQNILPEFWHDFDHRLFSTSLFWFAIQRHFYIKIEIPIHEQDTKGQLIKHASFLTKFTQFHCS